MKDENCGYVKLPTGNELYITARVVTDTDIDGVSLSDIDTPDVPFLVRASSSEGSVKWDSNLTDELGFFE